MEQISARTTCKRITIDVADAQDNLVVSKIAQSYSANINRKDAIKYKAGDLVMLSTINRRKDYKNADESRVAKLIPRYDSPYGVMDINNDTSMV